MMENKDDKLLPPYRVLELTDEKGDFCGKILGDLGADVIKIERPGGDPSRDLGPFYEDLPGRERSLSWLSRNTSKRGITLDITSSKGKEIFRRLAGKADFVIESFRPRYLEILKIGFGDLSRKNPRLIMTSITPFGRTGPYRDFEGSDLICMALGGQMSLCGEPDRAPLRFGVPQSYPLAGAWAAAASLAAHYHRQATGEGQHVDVSIQECVVGTCHNQQQFWDLNHLLMPVRAGVKISRGNLAATNLWPCKDGYVSWRVRTAGWSHWTRAFTGWMEDEGALDYLAGTDWESLDFGDMTQEEIDYLEAPFAKFFLNHTKEELFARSRQKGAGLFPLSTIEDLLKDPQLKERNYWVELEHPDLGASFVYPGVPCATSEGEWKISLRPPRVGEHNKEIYGGELGLTEEELIELERSQVI